MKKQLDELHAVLELHGIEMVEMPDEDSVMIRAGASDKPVKAAAVGGIADFDEIMQDVHKQNMRRILR